MTFAEKMKRARATLGLTQARMAALLATPRKTYCDYEAGRTVPHPPYQEGALARIRKASN